MFDLHAKVDVIIPAFAVKSEQLSAEDAEVFKVVSGEVASR